MECPEFLSRNCENVGWAESMGWGNGGWFAVLLVRGRSRSGSSAGTREFHRTHTAQQAVRSKVDVFLSRRRCECSGMAHVLERCHIQRFAP